MDLSLMAVAPEGADSENAGEDVNGRLTAAREACHTDITHDQLAGERDSA